jgi:hypothetical protein
MHIGLVSQSSFLRETDQELWEYLLVAHPDQKVSAEIVKEKEMFYDSYQQEVAIKTKPHISIAQFLAKEMMEETLIRWTQRICDLQRSFGVTLNNFSGFPPHTIYLRIQDPQPFRQLANQFKMIDSFIQSNDCPPACLVQAPHVAIAARLPETIYNEAIKQYAQKCFHASFQVDTLLLLKRRSEYDTYQLVNTFTLPPHLSLFE